jgi:hypothetical protein
MNNFQYVIHVIILDVSSTHSSSEEVKVTQDTARHLGQEKMLTGHRSVGLTQPQLKCMFSPFPLT